jgi:hypothetical protein
VNKDGVMPGLVPGIDVFGVLRRRKTWMAGISPAMTMEFRHCERSEAIHASAGRWIASLRSQ